MGSQAAVWVAEHLALGTQVAVKLIDPSLARKEEMRDRFRQEATAAAQLRSAHVVQILDHGIDGDQPFIVMELLEGEDLFERLHHRGRLTLYETSRIVTQVARALTRAHAAGIVHRDLKPENVFLVQNDDGEDEIVKVLDFGVAKIASTQPKGQRQRTEVGELLGTPHYMSPEQIKGLSEIDHRTDLWALGVIAYQCVIGELPFDSEGMGDLMIKIAIAEPPVPSQVMPDLTPAFDAWFEKACAREPTERHQSARAMADALARAVGISPDVLRGPPSAPRSEWASDGPAERAASTPRAQPAQPIVLVSELPPDSPRPASSRTAATAEKPVATLGDSEHPLSLPPVPVPLLRKRPDHGPDSRTGPDSKSSAAQPATIAEPDPRPTIVLVQPTEPEPRPTARAVSGDEKPAPETAALRSSPPSRSRPAAPIDPWSARVGTGTTAGLTAPTTEAPPPELDGSHRQRTGRWLALALLALGLVVAGVVVRSQLVVGSGRPPQTSGGTTWTGTASASIAPSTTSTSAAPDVSSPPVVVDLQDAGGRAIEPGARVERDGGRPAPGPLPKGVSSAKLGARPVAPTRAAPGAGDDIFIEVPEAPDESAPPRSRSAVPLE